MKKYINESFAILKKYCEDRAFQGWDPYDGLNSGIFQKLPLRYFAVFRLIWIQFFKRCPINLRKFFLIPQDHNPKGLALFISAYVNLYVKEKNQEHKQKIEQFADLLISLRSEQYNNFCWGYNFDWQSRAFFVPKYTPNVIVSTFAGNAFLDVYEISGDSKMLNIGVSICDFILQDLQRTYDGDYFCFSYTPLDKSRIYNASLLASRFLARVYSFTGNQQLKEEAKKSIEFCVKRQNDDGSWFYGMDNNQKWIDGFHTAYNLEALYDYSKYTKDNTYQLNYEKGFKYYVDNFFIEEGIPKFYNNNLWPIDVHLTAAAVSFLAKTGLFEQYSDFVCRVLNWTIVNMQDKSGYFYYQKKQFYTIKIPYMRWSLAWMFYALSLYLRRVDNK